MSDIDRQRRPLDRAILSKVGRGQCTAGFADVCCYRRREFALVKNARAFSGNGVQRIREMRNDNQAAALA